MILTEASGIYCPVCSGDFKKKESRSSSYPTVDGQLKNGKAPQRIYFCPNCEMGIAYPNLTEEQLKELYSQGEYWKNPTVKEILPKKDPAPYVLARTRWHIIVSYLEKEGNNKKVSMLDIGAGHGFLGLIAAENQDPVLSKYVMVEADNELRSAFELTWGKKNNNIDMMAIESIKKIKGEYHFIVFSHILEHVIDPLKFLQETTLFLAEGGLIFIDVPNQDYLYKNDVFPHVNFFNKKSLNILIKKCGFEIVWINNFGRNMKTSPCGQYCNNKIMDFIARVIYKFRMILPEMIPVKFFSWHLGAKLKNDNGTWIRVIGKKVSN